MDSLPSRLKRSDVYEEKVAQDAASDVLGNFSLTLLQARAAGVPAPVMRLRLMQVRSAARHTARLCVGVWRTLEALLQSNPMRELTAVRSHAPAPPGEVRRGCP